MAWTLPILAMSLIYKIGGIQVKCLVVHYTCIWIVLEAPDYSRFTILRIYMQCQRAKIQECLQISLLRMGAGKGTGESPSFAQTSSLPHPDLKNFKTVTNRNNPTQSYSSLKTMGLDWSDSARSCSFQSQGQPMEGRLQNTKDTWKVA